jgi:hypothetical protein
MTQLAKTVLNTDATSARGARTVMKSKLELLEGFDFNIKSPLSTCFFATYSIVVDRAADTLTVSIPSFVPTGEGGEVMFFLICCVSPSSEMERGNFFEG